MIASFSRCTADEMVRDGAVRDHVVRNLGLREQARDAMPIGSARQSISTESISRCNIALLLTPTEECG
jgi:hypothetical protein